MKLATELYTKQVTSWPQTGKQILGQFDDDSFVVYQAYNTEIGRYATTHNAFGGPFKLDRMSWIKPNFLWMMYRCGWGTKNEQEVVLAVSLHRSAFESIVAQAVHSTFVPELYSSEREWKQALATSEVRLQWDPDHDPSGAKVERHALQLGLSGETLAQYAHNWIVDIEDISAFVRQQKENAHTTPYTQLVMPKEEVYPLHDVKLAARLGLS